MKIIFSSALFSALIGVSSMCQAMPFEDIISEDVEAVLHIKSFSQTREDVLAHPLYEKFQDESVLDFFGGIYGTDVESSEPGLMEVLREEFGLTLDELFELFPGQGAYAFFNFSFFNESNASGQTTELGYSFKVGDSAILLEYAGEPERLDELLEIQFERNAASQKEANPVIEHELREERFMGETLYFDEVFDGESTYVEDGYALVNGIFALATSEDRLRSIVESIKVGSDVPLSENQAYLRSREAVAGQGDVAVYLNLERIMPALGKTFIDGMMRAGLAVYGVTSLSLEKALSLNSLSSFYLDIDLVEDGLSMNNSVLYSEKSGLLSLISYNKGALPDASYTPENAVAASTSLFDMGAMLSNLEALLTVASPSLPPLIDIQMQSLQKKTGVDFRASILENLGSEFVSFSILEKAEDELVQVQPQQFYVLEIKDTDALDRAIETLKDLIPGARTYIESQEFEGHTIFTAKVPQGQGSPGVRLSYAITRSALIIGMGDVGNLQKVLTDMNDSRAEGIWQEPEIEELYERIAQPGAVARSYTNFSAFVGPILESFLATGPFNRSGEVKLPKALTESFWVISESNESPEGFFTRVLFISEDG